MWADGVGASGAQFLAQALMQNHALRTLNVSSNAIGAEGARHLGRALQWNTALQDLV